MIALLLRVAMAMLRCKNAYTMKGGAKQAAADFGLGALLDGVLTFLVPLGTRATELHKGGMLTLMGAALDPIVDDRLVSPWALGNLALTLVENGLGWCCIILAAGSSTASTSSPIIPARFFHLFGLLPMGAALVLLALTRLAAASEQFGLSEEEMSLFTASQQGHASLARQLITRRAADVGQADDDGRTPLYVACVDGHEPVARLLLEHGAAFDQAKRYGATAPLFIACQFGHQPVARLLLERGAAVDQAMHGVGWSPLFVAAWSGHAPVVAQLLAHSADPAAATSADHLGIPAGSTPLSVAERQGHSAVVELLRGL